ncbi:MAG: SHOCT domain-containing protein [Phycisphaerales bacterium]|nr:SHOCT domain-containing protein [Phycisphaerales bacterium]MCB9855242.1 SHOCT domain-containing protein [Phycisphaerales bacterium]MCB9862835.1 SHOCT domain-containing protein [Phycisphaerales bacterium]
MQGNLSPAKSDVGDVVFWCAIIIVALLAMWIVGVWIRKKYLGDSGPSRPESALTLQQLRDMRRDGQITEDEFQTLKSQMIAQFKPTDLGDSD